ncbi:hypothetical protein C8N32_13116 [Rhodovulum imhoffii]|uniref:Uncharacterized protein n=1 Tax=Rhodovulum imhoffii TaxID=365340 RepID=A0A2T5BNM8_9RHOB|nr:hypothetical protein [Rhodovulum imhoffii]MBK5934607.1 hypothetical protein [Rhodovulum imhoffii]PTN00564.1 hypothetical protein C8N32_13116 [Rhodovulum imhoffii]
MTRRPVAIALVLAVLALLAFDLATSAPLNPYNAPPPIALGSGQASTGAHCGDLPGG